VEGAALDTQYTVITAPFDGQIGETTVNVGNLVSPSTPTPLATVVKLDPIYMEFSIGERDYLRARRSGTNQPIGRSQGLMVALQLVDGSIYEFQGRLVFLSPELDASTGTFLVRALFPNPHRVLRPGQFAKVILRRSRAERRVLVPEEAIVTKQAGTFVYVIVDGRAEERAVVRGDPRGSLRIIESGLDPGTSIVARGVHKVREGSPVDARELPALDLSSDPLSVAPPTMLSGDWYEPYLPEVRDPPERSAESGEY